jgi:YHS domain-containing protein
MRTFSTILTLSLFAACTNASAPAPAPEPQAQPVVAEAPAKVTQVDPSLVCMVNNHFMGTEQIRVAVDGKTYFGCCEMCKTRLADDPTTRAAKDPVSGATVDKAAAVIGREASGSVVYFENEKNLQLYASS